MHPYAKRGIAITPMKFGISFTATLMNQAGALVLVFRDGSVQVNHGGTEMGQGLSEKIRQIAADSLGVTAWSRCALMPTRTDKVPNTSPTAASASTDLMARRCSMPARQIRSSPDAGGGGSLIATTAGVESGEDGMVRGGENDVLSFERCGCRPTGSGPAVCSGLLSHA